LSAHECRPLPPNERPLPSRLSHKVLRSQLLQAIHVLVISRHGRFKRTTVERRGTSTNRDGHEYRSNILSLLMTYVIPKFNASAKERLQLIHSVITVILQTTPLLAQPTLRHTPEADTVAQALGCNVRAESTCRTTREASVCCSS
jgi:hypothetical protein